MTNQGPTQAIQQPNKSLHAAVAVMVGALIVIVAIIAGIFVLDRTSGAAEAPATPAVLSAPVTEATTPLDKQAPVAQETNVAPEAAQTEPAQEAPAQTQATQTQAAPAEPTQSQAAPEPALAEPAPTQAAPAPAPAAPVPFQPTCTTSKHTVQVGETFEIWGSHVPASVSVNWAFDHGDGFVDDRNPSFAYYNHPGTYTVTGIATVNHSNAHYVPCGTVTVTAPTPEYDCTIDDNHIPVNGHTVFRAASTHSDLPIIYTFDHGDGYSEVANPSYATYYSAGTYDVSVTAFYNGIATHVECGTVTVFAEVQPTCPAQSVVGMSEAQAHDAILAADCTPVTIIRGFEVYPVTGEYRSDRVLLTVQAGRVLQAVVG